MPFTDKEARKKYRAEWYRKNRERILVYAKQYREEKAEAVAAVKKRIYHERYKTDPVYKARMSTYGKQRRRKNPEHVKAIEKRYRESHPEVLRRINQKWSRTPERRARTTVNRAVRAGKLPRASTLACECGQPAREYHHHKGYERQHWLDVKPVCAFCHKNHHADLGSPLA